MEKINCRVLHVFSGFGGGISSVILNLAQNKDEGICFDTMAFSYNKGDQFVQSIIAEGGQCYTMPRPRKNGIRNFCLYIENVIGKGRYDVVHCHIAGWMAAPFARAAKKYQVKVFLVHAHTTKYDSLVDRIPIVRAIDQKLNNKWADAYMTCSDLAANYIFGEKYVSKKGVTLIPNGVSEERFANELSLEEKKQLRTSLNLPEYVKLVGHVGRFDTPKNHDMILDIAKIAVRQTPDIRFLLVGEGSRLKEIQQRCEKDGLGDTVMFLGRRTDVAQLMQLVDVMILPSFYEGLPTVAVECQASGTPMIISDSVTRQCDMGLGLVKFLPISSPAQWLEAILEMIGTGVPCAGALAKIKSNGFTAKTAGRLYCEKINELIRK